MRPVVLVLIAACGTARPPPRIVENVPAGVPHPDLPPLYAALFEAGQTWTFPLDAERRWDSGNGNGVERTTTAGTMTCTVTSARAIRGGRRAALACRPSVTDPEVLYLETTGDFVYSPSGDYVGTEDGLWKIDRFTDFDDDIATLDRKLMLMSADPAARAPGFDDGVSSVRVRRLGDDWCVTRMYDLDLAPAGWSLCFREGDGPVGGNEILQDSDSRLAHFGAAPRY
jgi:hypothetical protein